MSKLSRDEARRLLGDDCLDPEALAALLGRVESAPEIPFSRDLLSSRKGSHLLLFRPATLNGSPLTLICLLERCRELDDSLLRFQGDSPWFENEAFAQEEPVESGWALVARDPLPETRNLTYDAGEAAMRRSAGDAPWRRRRAVEIAFDCLAVAAGRRVRPLAKSFDWSSTESSDGGLVNVGGYGDTGLQVLSYSKPVKHGGLGICPTLVGR